MKPPEFITTNPTTKSNTNSESTCHLQPQTRLGSYFQLARSWLQFMDSQGVILIECLQRCNTVTGQQYSGRLKCLREVIKQKARNAHKRNSRQFQWLSWQQFTVVNASFSPSTLFSIPVPLRRPSFPNKKVFAGCYFASDDDVIATVEVVLESQTKVFFYTGIKAL